MQIICYTGGTCGDLVAAVIDTTEVVISNSQMIIPNNRSQLKKPHMFDTDQQKDQYIDNMCMQYKSIPSHDLQYHSQRQHDFIGIVVETKSVAHWAACRFKNLHRPRVWQAVSQLCNIATVDDYAQMLLDFGQLLKTKTKKIIYLEDILDGQLLQNLRLLNVEANDALYRQWLAQQNVN